MIDVQSRRDRRKIDIKKVGVKGIQYPSIVQDRANEVQHVNATVNMYVNLPHQFKGTHMSRFIEIQNPHALKLSVIERIVWAWVLTIPAAGGLAWGMVSLLPLMH